MTEPTITISLTHAQAIIEAKAPIAHFTPDQKEAIAALQSAINLARGYDKRTERVALAIYDGINEGGTGPWDDYIKIAQAAIKAMEDGQ